MTPPPAQTPDDDDDGFDSGSLCAAIMEGFGLSQLDAAHNAIGVYVWLLDGFRHGKYPALIDPVTTTDGKVDGELLVLEIPTGPHFHPRRIPHR